VRKRPNSPFGILPSPLFNTVATLRAAIHLLAKEIARRAHAIAEHNVPAVGGPNWKIIDTRPRSEAAGYAPLHIRQPEIGAVLPEQRDGYAAAVRRQTEHFILRRITEPPERFPGTVEPLELTRRVRGTEQ
jgi:hypothetical protein